MINRAEFWKKLADVDRRIRDQEATEAERESAIAELRDLVTATEPDPAYLVQAIADSPLKGIRLKHLVMTSSACPTQWDAYDTEGAYYYIRYRWGRLRVDANEAGGPTLFGVQLGDAFHGSLDESDMLHATGFVVDEDTDREKKDWMYD